MDSLLFRVQHRYEHVEGRKAALDQRRGLMRGGTAGLVGLAAREATGGASLLHRTGAGLLHLDPVIDAAHAQASVREVLGALLHPALRHASLQGRGALRHLDIQLAGIDVGVLGQPLAQVFGQALVGTGVVLRAYTAIPHAAVSGAAVTQAVAPRSGMALLGVGGRHERCSAIAAIIAVAVVAGIAVAGAAAIALAGLAADVATVTLRLAAISAVALVVALPAHAVLPRLAVARRLGALPPAKIGR